MNLHVVTSGPQGGDWDVVADPTSATVADLARAVGLDAPGAPAVLVDGRVMSGSATLADAAIVRGAELAVVGPTPAAETLVGAATTAGRPQDALWLDQVAGLTAGATASLGPGRHAVGAPLSSGADVLSSGLVREPCLQLDAAVPPDRFLTIPGALLRTRAAAPPPRPLTPDERGMVTLHRSPGAPAPAPLGPPLPPAAAPEPAAPAPFSWATLLVPLPVALVMALVVSPRFALAAAAAPVVAAGRWAESRVRWRRHRRRHRRTVAVQVLEHAAAQRSVAEAERCRRWEAHPDPTALRRAADAGAAPLWSRRLADSDALALVVGAGAVPWTAAEPRRALLAHPAPHEASLDDAPVVARLLERHAVGVVGPPAAARSLARWLVAQAALLHGPADLAIAALVSPGAESQWSWLKWLPHVVDAAGGRRAAASPDDAATVVAALVAEMPAATSRLPLGRAALVVVDDHALARTPALREAIVRAGSPLRAVVVASDRDALPAWCDVVADVAGDGTLRMSGLDEPPAGPGLAVGVTEAWATAAARAVGRFDDPELAGRSPVPTDVALADVLGVAETLDDPEAMARRLVLRWRSRNGDLAAPLGRTATGTFAVDLVADGPHALVAGTTGSGKSELLRSWVAAMAASASPDDLNVVLVDFKGGGAFDACADLPHTVGVVTDLDAPLAARALRCLRAEVRYREARLRAASCRDLAEYATARRDEPLPRLVVVIDEFATLVAELPDFVASIVDVAQRGRSLGIHLVLATQRPQGVVDAKVRANTNLRIALRVQDAGDALDVVGCPDPTRLSRRNPGRAYARLGTGDVTLFQTGLVSCHSAGPGVGAEVTARRFALMDGTPVPRPGDGAAADATGTNAAGDLARLVVGARLAAHRAGCRPPRVPWPAPLPATVDAAVLWTDTTHEPWSAALGLADEPDAQRQAVWRWSAATGNLLVYGARLDDAGRVLTTLALGLAAHHRADEVHLYVVDGGGSAALRSLAALPHCGALVQGSDVTRTARLLALLTGIVEERRSLVRDGSGVCVSPGSCLPLVVFVVDHVGGVLEALDDGGERDAPARLAALARDGAELGVVTVASAHHERAVPGRLASLFPQRVALRMADPASYLALGLSPRELPSLAGLRGVVVGAATEVQFGQIDDPDVTARTIAARTPPGRRLPPPVRVLGPVAHLADVGGGPGTIDERTWTLTVAAAATLEPVQLALPRGVHALVAGPPASGRSTALAALARATLRAGGGRARVVVVGSQRSPLLTFLGDEAAAAVTADDAATLDAALAAAAADEVFVLVAVDDAELVPPALAQAVARHAEAAAPRVRFTVAGRADQLRASGAWAAVLRHGRTGIALQPSAGDGDLFRATFPIRLPFAPSPGRGVVVSLGTPVAAQVLTGP